MYKRSSRLQRAIRTGHNLGQEPATTRRQAKPRQGNRRAPQKQMLRAALPKAALAAKRRAGERTGEVPFGWRLDDAGRLAEDAAEQNVLAKIMVCRAAGMSLRQIAAILTDAGHRTKKGKATWTHTTVKSILGRQAALAA